MEKVLRLNKKKKWDEISIVLTDDSEITLINQKYLSKQEATDVISFSLDPMPGDKNTFSGEIVVNVERAIERALEENKEGWSTSRELALYIAHGCNHLSGATDYEPEDRAAMRLREMDWLSEMEELDFIDGLLNK